MLDHEATNQKQQELAVHRRRLEHLFQQYATLGAYTPPYIALDIEQTQTALREIKVQLRSSAIQIEDHPDDERTVQVVFPLQPALHQLRAPIGDFVGREKEIEQLVQALRKANGTVTAIGGVRGMGGIGKTELSYVVANELKDIFPDAQIVVELGGASNPLSPKQALERIIRSFEWEVQLPDNLSQLQAFYRSVLSGKRVLILADDAEDAAQIHPLLPPLGCALLVTSRNRFSLPGMQTINLEALSSAESQILLLEICPRIEKHAEELAKLCAYLPLALRVSASFLKENDSRDVGSYVDQLQNKRLKYLRDPENPNDPQASVEASLQLSYGALEPAAQSALSQMSEFPSSFPLDTARTVIIVEGNIEEVLELLRRRSLLEWESITFRPNFYLHDLVREFAAARLKDPFSVRRRLINYINHSNYELLGKLPDDLETLRTIFPSDTDTTLEELGDAMKRHRQFLGGIIGKPVVGDEEAGAEDVAG